MSSSQIASIKAQSHLAFCVVNDACRIANYVIDSLEKGPITFPLLLLPSTFSWPDHYLHTPSNVYIQLPFSWEDWHIVLRIHPNLRTCDCIPGIWTSIIL
ncbi:hypothetical protein K439DRAFT_1641789 [Ramaria rubella]|nr:hypothetical protein K439DRAFT_1641789 [Ramaria rubella]